MKEASTPFNQYIGKGSRQHTSSIRSVVRKLVLQGERLLITSSDCHRHEFKNRWHNNRKEQQNARLRQLHLV